MKYAAGLYALIAKTIQFELNLNLSSIKEIRNKVRNKIQKNDKLKMNPAK